MGPISQQHDLCNEVYAFILLSFSLSWYCWSFFSKLCRLWWCWHSLAYVMCSTEPSIFSQNLDITLACVFITECAALVSHTDCKVLVDSSAESFLLQVSQLPCLRCSTMSSLFPCHGTIFLSLFQSEPGGGLCLDSSSCLVKVKSGIQQSHFWAGFSSSWILYFYLGLSQKAVKLTLQI